MSTRSRTRVVVFSAVVLCFLSFTIFRSVRSFASKMPEFVAKTAAPANSTVRTMELKFRGRADIVEALQSGVPEARSLSTADLNGDGAPDVVAGYDYNGSGIITVQFGNTDAFAPTDDSVFERMHNGYDPDALLPTVETYVVPQSADLLQVGDFDHDNHGDALVATPGGDLYLLSGDG